MLDAINYFAASGTTWVPSRQPLSLYQTKKNRFHLSRNGGGVALLIMASKINHMVSLMQSAPKGSISPQEHTQDFLRSCLYRLPISHKAKRCRFEDVLE